MSGTTGTTQDAVQKGRATAKRAGKVVRSAVIAGAKAGAEAALMVGAAEFAKGWEESKPEAAAERKRRAVTAVVAGAAVLAIAGAVARKRRKRRKGR